MYRVNPPLVRAVATLPLYLAGIELADYSIDPVPPARPEFDLGRQFVDRHGARAFWYFTVARWACIPFALLSTWVVHRWAADLYGPPAGAFAALLWVVCPNVLAYAQLITPDSGAAAFGALAGYTFWRWLKTPTWGAAALAGLTLGAAELCKTTWLLLVPLWPTLWVVYRAGRGARWGREIGQLTTAFAFARMVLNVGFGFEGTGTALGDLPFVSKTLTRGLDDDGRGNRFAGTVAGRLPIPVPVNYLLGIDVQKSDFEARLPGYLRGEWRNGGWWYYYLYGLLVKTPVGTLVIFAAAVCSTLVRNTRTGDRRDELVAIAHGVGVVAFVSSQSDLNHHLRYILPGLPFLFVWMGRMMSYDGPRPTVWRLGSWTAGVAAAVSSLAVYPHSLSYFNEPSGGPLRGGEHLVGSNIDWGQDLLYLKRWLDDHPEARPVGIAYYGYVDPHTAGIDFFLPPGHPPVDGTSDLGGPRPGWFAVSVNFLRGARYMATDENGAVRSIDRPSFSYFRRFQPVAAVGYSIRIYHVTESECNRVRAELGLPPVRSARTEGR
ncbi:MAG TPA: glycosyltransferase family 39 protein [Urbifossiella sp.]|nr:glycosyltransferase family 39 protein [Urbifossiella sp.]